MSVDPLLQMVLAGAMALLFLGAAHYKRRDPARFRAQLAAYRLTPDGLVRPAASALPFVELAAALLLLPAATRSAGSVLAMGLLLTYALAMAINLRRGRRAIDCGCGGPAQPLSWLLVARNLGLTLAASLLLPGAASRTLHTVDAVLAVGLVVLLALTWATVEQLLRNSSALHRGAA